MTRKPLEGLEVLDFSSVYAGPICTRLLSDCGANVTKVEPPVGGDITRGPKGTSRVYTHFNSGKSSITLNLNSSEGQDLARRLASTADVVVENYRPGIMKRFGLDQGSLRADNPALVYCSISGFGQSGPYVDRAAYAPIAHAASGFDAAHAGAQPPPNDKPPVWSIMIADMLTGVMAYGAIATALAGRASSGLGDYIDVTMMESMMWLIPAQLQIAQMDEAPPAGGFRPIAVQDGFVMICIVSPKNMRCLCEAIGRPDMADDPDYQGGNRWKNMDDFVAQIEAWSIKLTAQECETRLNEAGVPCSVYNEPGDLLSHPQLLERQSFQAFEDELGTYMVQNAPFQFADTDIKTAVSSASLGEHTAAILADRLSLDASQLDKLRDEGVI